MTSSGAVGLAKAVVRSMATSDTSTPAGLLPIPQLRKDLPAGAVWIAPFKDPGPSPLELLSFCRLQNSTPASSFARLTQFDGQSSRSDVFLSIATSAMGDYLNCGVDGNGLKTVAIGLNKSEVTKEDRIRERELFRFYRPDDAITPEIDGQFSPSSPPQLFDSSEPSPITNNDVTLAALAQLVALRLGVHRAMINVIGRESQYTLVESTKTLDLVNQVSGEREGDEAWIGSGGILHKSTSICDNVVALPTGVDHPFLIVPDLTLDERFKDRPYVRGHPHYRFYAGTPLRTARGVVIGALCAFAHHPRTISETEMAYMATISETIMQHLEMKRAAAERDKVTRMSRGLNAFVEGKASQFPTSIDSKALHDSLLTHTPAQPKRTQESSSTIDTVLRNAETSHAPGKGNFENTPTPQHENAGHRDAEGTSTKQTEASGEPSKSAIEEQFQATLSRAAGLLGEALGLRDDGGVVFYDTVARIDAPDSDISGPTSPLEGKDSDAWSNPSDGPITPGPHSGFYEFEEARAPLLGACISDRYDDSNPDEPYRDFTCRMLTKIIKRYPSGRTWEFDEHGAIPGQDEASLRQDASSRQNAAEREVRQRIEAEFLMSIFPGVRSLVFVPLWDANSSRHYASCFAWTTDLMGRFSADVEFSFVTAFGNSISAEISRLATIDADQRKSDFIGSVSHELRSPLHGVLASAEFLADTNLDSFQSTLVNTIDSCGRTLLDTINHVLDFSKINSLRRTWRKTQRMHKSHTPQSSRDHKSIQSSGIMSILGSTDVAAITEEVVDSVYAGKIYAKAFSPADITDLNASGMQRRDSEQPKWQDSAKTGVQVLLDIAPGDYNFVTQPGAIRRIVMNIFGNALKYTEKGSISVRLWQQGDPDEFPNTHKVVFVVKDTGKGISSGYLRTRLYTPFAQENDLAPGTGLGLSIVRNIVTMLKGDINIRSKIGRGTEVRITLPRMMRPNTSQVGEPDTIRPALTDFAFLRERKEKIVVGLYGFTLDASGKPQELERILRRYLEDWCDVKNVVDVKANVKASVVIVDEQNLEKLQRSAVVVSSESIVVLCKNPAPLQTPKGITSRHYFLLKPFGPYKLSRTIRKCLERSHNGKHRPISFPSGLTVPESNDSKFISLSPSNSDNAKAAMQETADDSENTSKVRKGMQSSGKSTVMDMSSQEIGTTEMSESAIDDSSGLVSPPLTAPVHKSPTEAAPGNAQHIPRILVVDDNRTNLTLLKTFLKKKKGLSSDSATDGAMAVKEATTNQYDIIFMDISMPVMNGFEATREIRKHEEGLRRQLKRKSSEGARSRPSSRVWQPGPVEMTPSPSQNQHQQTSGLINLGSSVNDGSGDGGGNSNVTPIIPAKPATPPIILEDDATKEGSGSFSTKVAKPALIIALTGLASGRDQSEAFTSGVDLYMTKPVSFREVGKLIDNWTANRGLAPTESR